MVLTAAKLEGFISHTLDGSPGAPISTQEIINQVGEWFVSQNTWRFNQRRTKLSVRRSISITGATYADAAKTLTKAGAFAGYKFLAGDILEVDLDANSLGNSTPGEFLVASKQSDSQITLQDALGVNLIEQSEAFDNAYWTQDGTVTFVANTTGTTDPRGGNTAYEINDQDAAVNAGVTRDFTTLTSGNYYAFSWHVKQVSGGPVGVQISVRHDGGSKLIDGVFNTTSGVFTTTNMLGGAEGSISSETMANGWYRLWVVLRHDSSDSATVQVAIRTALTPVSLTGAHYVWGAQLEEVSAATSTPTLYETRPISGGVDGTIPNNVIALPVDCSDIIAIASNTDTLPGFRWTDQEDMAYNRVGRRLFENFGLRGAIMGYQTTTGKIEYRLELDPNQSANTDRLEVRYISGWKRITTDTEELPLPADGWLDGLFTQAVIAWSQGLDAEDEAPLYARMDDLARSEFWRSHVARDATVQSDMGSIRGSDINKRFHGGRRRFHDISTSP